ncbi:MAG: AMP-binding protein, partial [Paracoccaceae bacterium]
MTLWHDPIDQQIAERPDALAILDSVGTEWCYADLDRAIADVETVLTGQGLKRGQRVLLLAENCAAAVAVLFACSRQGVAVIPVNARQTAAEVERVKNHAEPALILATTAVSQNAMDHAARLGGTKITGAFGALHMCQTEGGDADTPEDVAVLLYTTGTTGTPKGVMITHDNLVFAGQAAQTFRALGPGHRVYGVAPISHVIGLASMLTATLTAGATAGLEGRVAAERVLNALRDGLLDPAAGPPVDALLMQNVRARGVGEVGRDALVNGPPGGAPVG